MQSFTNAGPSRRDEELIEPLAAATGAARERLFARNAALVMPLLEAVALAHAAGATALEERALAALVATGVRPRRSATAGVGALTPSERRIARLASLGLTNSEIAAEAVIVPKTVQFHLTNVYRKLAIAGRAELAEALRSEA